MRTRLESAKLAGEILRAMETGSRARLREGLDRAAILTRDLESLPPHDAEQLEVLSAIAEQICTRWGVSEVELSLLRHFAGTVRVYLS